MPSVWSCLLWMVRCDFMTPLRREMCTWIQYVSCWMSDWVALQWMMWRITFKLKNIEVYTARDTFAHHEVTCTVIRFAFAHRQEWEDCLAGLNFIVSIKTLSTLLQCGVWCLVHCLATNFLGGKFFIVLSDCSRCRHDSIPVDSMRNSNLCWCLCLCVGKDIVFTFSHLGSFFTRKHSIAKYAKGDKGNRAINNCFAAERCELWPGWKYLFLTSKWAVPG